MLLEGLGLAQNCSFDPALIELRSFPPILMKSLLYGLTFSALLWAFSTVPALAAFSDVPSDHPNADAIAFVQAQGIVSGYPDGTFRPDATINRAEFTKIIVASQFNAAEIAACSSSDESSFTDVDGTAWYANYICLARKKGVIGGYPDGTFRPEADVNFAEAAKIIVTAFGYKASSGGSVWYEPFVRVLADHHAIPVSVTGFDWSLTRGQMAEIIFRLKTGNTAKPSQAFDSLTSFSSSEYLNRLSDEAKTTFLESYLPGKTFFIGAASGSWGTLQSNGIVSYECGHEEGSAPCTGTGTWQLGRAGFTLNAPLSDGTYKDIKFQKIDGELIVLLDHCAALIFPSGRSINELHDFAGSIYGRSYCRQF
jgi:hypothetical protein